MKNIIYKITGSVLVLLGLSLALYFCLTFIPSKRLKGIEEIGVFILISIVVLVSGIHYLSIGFKNKTTNNIIFTSAVIQLIGVGLLLVITFFIVGSVEIELYLGDISLKGMTSLSEIIMYYTTSLPGGLFFAGSYIFLMGPGWIWMAGLIMHFLGIAKEYTIKK